MSDGERASCHMLQQLLLLLLAGLVGPGWRCESLMASVAYITDIDGLDLGMRPGGDWAAGSYGPHIAQRACASAIR